MLGAAIQFQTHCDDVDVKKRQVDLALHLAMSALCQKRTFVSAIPMSALSQKAQAGPSRGTLLFSVALSLRSSLTLLVAATRLRVGLPLNQSIKLSDR